MVVPCVVGLGVGVGVVGVMLVLLNLCGEEFSFGGVRRKVFEAVFGFLFLVFLLLGINIVSVSGWCIVHSIVQGSGG